MSHNDSVFSGLTAYSGREIASELGGWSHGESSDFGMLIGAVMSLAREVDRITPQVIDHDAGPSHGVQGPDGIWRAVPGAGPAVLVPAGAAAAIQHQAGQLELVYAGLREVVNILETGRQYKEAHALGAVLMTAQARLAAMLGAGEQS
jgi:hypothetical protein